MSILLQTIKDVPLLSSSKKVMWKQSNKNLTIKSSEKIKSAVLNIILKV